MWFVMEEWLLAVLWLSTSDLLQAPAEQPGAHKPEAVMSVDRTHHAVIHWAALITSPNLWRGGVSMLPANGLHLSRQQCLPCSEQLSRAQSAQNDFAGKYKLH